jgi:putative ABC transport system permease protein
LLIASALFDHAFAAVAPETRADRTLGVYGLQFRGPNATSTGQAGYGFLDRYVRGLPGAEEVALFSQQRPVASYRDGQRLNLFLKQTDGAYWRVLDFSFLEGGPITDEDDELGRPVAVISRETRERLFDGEPALGREIVADGQTLSVIGVVEDVSFARLAGFADVWVPIGSAKSQDFRRAYRGAFMALILARDRSDFPRLKAEFRSALQSVEFPDDTWTHVAGGADTLFETMARNVFSPDWEETRPWALRVALLALGLVFVSLPAVNLVNLNVSRILERSSEIGVRKAFGAPTGALVRQLVTENVVLTLLGGVLALVVAAASLELIESLGLIPHARLGISWRVFGAGLLMALAFGVLSGAWPAWTVARLHPVEALRGGAS